jgi:cation transport regulator ChaC
LFGYGSLINAASRAATAETGAGVPVVLGGAQRRWAVQIDNEGTRWSAPCLTDSPLKYDRSAGVVFELASPAALAAFDAREAPWYTRAVLDASRLVGWEGEEGGKKKKEESKIVTDNMLAALATPSARCSPLALRAG